MIDLVNALDKDRFEPIIGFHTDNFLVPVLRESGIETHIFDNPSSFSFGNRLLDTVFAPIKKLINFFKKFLLPAFRYAKFIRGNSIDMVNANNSVVRNHAWMFAARIANTPCITHEMGINDSFSKASRYFAKRLKAIICVSNIVKDNMVRLGLDYPHITVIHNGQDMARYTLDETPEQLRTKYRFNDNDPIVGVVGNIKWWKGQETIVRAIVILVRKYPNIRCMLVGAAPEQFDEYGKTLESICREHDIQNNVIFTGFQENAIDYMNLMDIVVHTSVEPEPFGIVILEGMLLSKPVISTTIGGPAEIIENNESGVLVTPGDPELLASAIDHILCNREFAARIGKGGHERLLKEFTIEKNAAKTMRIYDEILGT